MTRPINLTTITEKSSLAQINNNFRKIQEELSIFRQNVEPRIKASEDYRDYLELFLGGDRPISRQQAINYTDEQIAAKEAEILEELDSRIGDVNAKIDNLEQLGEDLIEQISTSITELENELTETKEALSKKADLLWTEAQLALKADRELLDTMVTNLEESIATKADAEWVEGRLQTKADVENTYTKQEVDNALNSKVSVTTYTVDKEGFIQQFENHESRISQTEEAISQTVSKTEFEEVQNELGDVVTRLSNAETAIIQNAEQIELRATKDEVDGLENRLGLAETAIMQNSQEIQLRATKAELDEIEDRISSAETMITQNAEQIQLRATKSELEELAADVAGLETRLSNAETSITQNAEEIELRATKTEVQQLENELNAISTRVSNAETAITQNAEEINLRATKEEVQLIEDEVSSISQNVANLTVAYDNISSEVSRIEQDLDGKIQANTSLIQQTAQGINARIDEFKYEYDQDKTDILSSVEQNRSEINALSDQIQLRVTREEFENLQKDVDERIDGAIDRISQAEATLSIHADQIEAKAEKSEVYTRSEVDSALGEKVDTTVFTEQIGTLTTSINSVSARVSNTETAINSITGEIEDVLNQVSSLEVTTNGIIQSVSSIEGELSEVGNRLTQAETSITSLADEIELKASKTEVDTLERRMSEAEASLSVLPGQIEARVEKDGVIGAINASPEELLIEFDRIRMEGMLEARHIRSLAGLNVNDQFIVDSNGNVKLANDTVTIDRLGIKVKEADFLTEDAQSGIVSKIVPMTNLIRDHSFELIKAGNILSDGYYTIAESPAWQLKGNPRCTDSYPHGHDASPIAPFGDQSVLVNSSNYVIDRDASTYMSEGETYTLSAYFYRPFDHGVGTPQFRIRLFQHNEVNGQPVNEILYTSTSNFSPVPSDYSVVRYSHTFTLPSNFKWIDPITWVEIEIKSTNSTWVAVDGVQLVRGTYPTAYDAEDSLWRVVKGYIPTYPVGMLDTLWTGALYPLSTHTIRPSKNLSECKTGWVLQWQAYNRGEGSVANSDYQYTHIPKNHIFNSGTGVRSVLGRGGVGVIGKYVYVYDDRIVGHDSNNQGDNHNLVLTGVFEY